VFQSIESSVDGTGRHGAVKAVLNFVQDGAAITFVSKRCSRVREREEDSLLEGSKIRRHGVYIVYNKS